MAKGYPQVTLETDLFLYGAWSGRGLRSPQGKWMRQITQIRILIPS